MNKDSAKDYLPLVQALADGRVIQWRNYAGDWLDSESPTMSDEPGRYRIKPEPREWWVVVNKVGGVWSVLSSKPDFDAITRDGMEVVHVREVLPQ